MNEQLPDHLADPAADPALHRALLAGVLDPTVAIDDHGVIVLASESCERVFGWRSDELLGRNVKVLMPEPHHSQHDGYLEHYRATGETGILGRTREFTVITKQGRSVDVELSVSRVDGLPQPLFIGSFRDISDRKAAERSLNQSEKRLQDIFDRSFEYIGLLSPDGTVLEANRASLHSIGVERGEVVGRPLWETPWWSLSEDHRRQLRQALERANQGSFVRFETEHPCHDGGVRAIDFSISPLLGDDGEVVLLVAEGRDITELKRAQRSETAVLRALATVGESAAVLAHEIKNPITSINAALCAVADKLGEDQRDVLDQLVERMKRLESIMRRTLSFTRPMDLYLAGLDVGELLEQVAGDLRPGAEVCDLRLEVIPPEPALKLEGDAQLLSELLTNLVTNAVESLEENGGTRIQLSAARTEGDTAEIVVDDDGPGIPDSALANLFKPFHTTKRSGTGLGLAFCRKIAEEHGGTVEAGVSPLSGARFVVRLPAPT